jgi:predicted phosphoribosyltransferase
MLSTTAWRTGATMLATLWSLAQERPQRLVVALPVATDDAVDILAEAADEGVVLQVPINHAGIIQFYSDFSQTSDDEVVDILEDSLMERRGVGYVFAITADQIVYRF